MHRADPRAGQHRDHGLRHHRHIEDDAVALGDAEILHNGGERLHLMQHLGVGQFGDAAGQRRIVDQRHLAGAAAGDVTVERVVAGVDHRAGEPATVKSASRIEDLFRRLDPVDVTRSLAPKTLGIPERAGMDLMIPAVVLDVHGVSLLDAGDNRDLFTCHCHRKQHHFKGGLDFRGAIGLFLTAICAPSRSSSWASDL